jgi:SprT protein
MVNPELHQQAIDTIENVINKARLYFGSHFEYPELSYRLKGKVAGKAYLQQWQIRLNPILFNENRTEFLNEVIAHEIAHLITYKQFGRVKPHGVEWRSVMQRVFGLSANTTHQFSVASVQGKQFAYRCLCSAHQLTIRRHNKIIRHQATYRCAKCHDTLVYCG